MTESHAARPARDRLPRARPAARALALLLGLCAAPAAVAAVAFVEPKPGAYVVCGFNLPAQWCNDRSYVRPSAYAVLRGVRDGTVMGGVTFFKDQPALNFDGYAAGLAFGDYKLVVEDTHSCDALKAKAAPGDKPGEAIRIRAEFNLSTLYAEVDGVARVSADVLGVSVEGGPLPIRDLYLLVASGSDLTEASVPAASVLACGRIRKN